MLDRADVNASDRAVPDTPPRRHADGPAEIGAPRTGLRILVADDSPLSRAVVRLMLERRGHRVTVAGSGAEAVEACEGARFDAILMDVQMPGMDGVEATRRIRAAETDGTRMPIVAVTATASGDGEARLHASGMTACLVKPVDLRKLEAVLATVVRA